MRRRRTGRRRTWVAWTSRVRERLRHRRPAAEDKALARTPATAESPRRNRPRPPRRTTTPSATSLLTAATTIAAVASRKRKRWPPQPWSTSLRRRPCVSSKRNAAERPLNARIVRPGVSSVGLSGRQKRQKQPASVTRRRRRKRKAAPELQNDGGGHPRAIVRDGRRNDGGTAVGGRRNAGSLRHLLRIAISNVVPVPRRPLAQILVAQAARAADIAASCIADRQRSPHV
mmetsp:Transcript_1810/g.3508  ORF Transcript_1810/g.3508 Transcript_1810/m.3508 type:complete len:230 (+) Transcript_1810:1126-1815(+)